MNKAKQTGWDGFIEGLRRSNTLEFTDSKRSLALFEKAVEAFLRRIGEVQTPPFNAIITLSTALVRQAGKDEGKGDMGNIPKQIYQFMLQTFKEEDVSPLTVIYLFQLCLSVARGCMRTGNNKWAHFFYSLIVQIDAAFKTVDFITLGNRPAGLLLRQNRHKIEEISKIAIEAPTGDGEQREDFLKTVRQIARELTVVDAPYGPLNPAEVTYEGFSEYELSELKMPSLKSIQHSPSKRPVSEPGDKPATLAYPFLDKKSSPEDAFVGQPPKTIVQDPPAAFLAQEQAAVSMKSQPYPIKRPPPRSLPEPIMPPFPQQQKPTQPQEPPVSSTSHPRPPTNTNYPRREADQRAEQQRISPAQSPSHPSQPPPPSQLHSQPPQRQAREPQRPATANPQRPRAAAVPYQGQQQNQRQIPKPPPPSPYDSTFAMTPSQPEYVGFTPNIPEELRRGKSSASVPAPSKSAVQGQRADSSSSLPPVPAVTAQPPKEREFEQPGEAERVTVPDPILANSGPPSGTQPVEIEMPKAPPKEESMPIPLAEETFESEPTPTSAPAEEKLEPTPLPKKVPPKESKPVKPAPPKAAAITEPDLQELEEPLHFVASEEEEEEEELRPISMVHRYRCRFHLTQTSLWARLISMLVNNKLISWIFSLIGALLGFYRAQIVMLDDNSITLLGRLMWRKTTILSDSYVYRLGAIKQVQRASSGGWRYMFLGILGLVPAALFGTLMVIEGVTGENSSTIALGVGVIIAGLLWDIVCYTLFYKIRKAFVFRLQVSQGWLSIETADQQTAQRLNFYLRSSLTGRR